MSSWTERMHRRAATFGTVVTSCGHQNVPYPRRLEKVKFGFPLDLVCKHGIPGPLLVLILKLNKEAAFKKDVFRAPGHQANIKKLAHFLQNGRLVNLDNFSIYTIASVLKKFLRKIPGGIFGADNEERLFNMIALSDTQQRRDSVHRLITSLPSYTQHLLVLLFGTFRVIATNADRCRSGMSSEALGVSVAPSFFTSCVSDGKEARHEDVQRFKDDVEVAMRVMKFLIDNFGVSNLFGRDNYEFYARITGRVLKVEQDWIFSFRYPPDSLISPLSSQDECRSTPALLQLVDSVNANTSTANTVACLSASCSSAGAAVVAGDERLARTTPAPSETTLRDSRLSVSLEDRRLFEMSSVGGSRTSSCVLQLTLDELRDINMYAESTKSLSFLPMVHERQTQRMRTRSEWFLTSSGALSRRMAAVHNVSAPLAHCQHRQSCVPSASTQADPTAVAVAASAGVLLSDSVINTPAGASAGGGVERTSKRLLRRSSSKKNKENGARVRAMLTAAAAGGATVASSQDVYLASSGSAATTTPSITQESRRPLSEHEYADDGSSLRSLSLALYKPRI